MRGNLQVNADRFLGFANIYDSVRPKCPEKIKDILIKYLREKPNCVVDLGCGTGLSTITWSNTCNKVIGIEPSRDMIEIANEKATNLENVEFNLAFSDKTGLENNIADIITCSQSFHWMNPKTTLNEVDRILKVGGVFAVYDCEWPPISSYEAEIEYNKLFKKVIEIESSHPKTKDKFIKWNKKDHLSNIRNSNKFKYVREIVFSNSEICNAERFIAIALSQGGLQQIIKSNIDEINLHLDNFQERIYKIFGETEFEIEYCYRMYIGIK